MLVHIKCTKLLKVHSDIFDQTFSNLHRLCKFWTCARGNSGYRWSHRMVNGRWNAKVPTILRAYAFHYIFPNAVEMMLFRTPTSTRIYTALVSFTSCFLRIALLLYLMSFSLKQHPPRRLPCQAVEHSVQCPAGRTSLLLLYPSCSADVTTMLVMLLDSWSSIFLSAVVFRLSAQWL